MDRIADPDGGADGLANRAKGEERGGQERQDEIQPESDPTHEADATAKILPDQSRFRRERQRPPLRRGGDKRRGRRAPRRSGQSDEAQICDQSGREREGGDLVHCACDVGEVRIRQTPRSGRDPHDVKRSAAENRFESAADDEQGSGRIDELAQRIGGEPPPRRADAERAIRKPDALQILSGEQDDDQRGEVQRQICERTTD